jgi:BirA family transcriptional regulator, biotin operon repressor / biotin---[acetyl-CoA-carboxylase] ligase
LIIITDSKEYAENIFSITSNWQNNIEYSNQTVINRINNKLFQNNNLFTTEIESDPLWQYAFIVNHAPSSQFTALIELSKDDPDLPSGILCLAASGDNFKGYRNRSWISLPGNIHLSAFIKPNKIVQNFHIGFTILSALTVIEAIDEIPELENKANIKWVNDILINDGKVAGVLTQTQTVGKQVTNLFIGIGINVKTTPVIENDFIIKKATSINEHIIHKSENNEALLLNNLLQFLSKNYQLLLNGKYSKILDDYRNHSEIIGKNIIVYSDPIEGEPQMIKSGKVEFIGDNLELILENQKEPVVRGRIIIN